MINVSEECRQLMQTAPSFFAAATITFKDGSILELGDDDFTAGTSNIADGASVSGIPLGVAVCRKLTMEIINYDDRFVNKDFFGAKIQYFLKMPLSQTTETINMGTFTVNTPESYGEVVKITACDDMYKLDTPFSSGLEFPVSAGELFRDICSNCDVPFISSEFRNAEFQVPAPAEEMTFRQVMGYIAMIAVGNARVSRTGYMEILEYDFTDFREEVNTARHDLADWITLKTDVSDIQITGIQTTQETENGYLILMVGSEGYVISVENPLTVGQENEFLALIEEVFLLRFFRKFEGDYISDPTIEFMDLAKITDRRGNICYSFVTDAVITSLGGTDLSNSAQSAMRIAQNYAAPEAKAIIEAKKLVEKEKTDREMAIAQLSQTIANSSGFYETNETQEDGSVITYLHDKPTLAASMYVVMITAQGFVFSTDGGQTYPHGWTVTGEMVMAILSAEGINANWIQTGILQSEDGESFYLNLQTGELRMKMNSSVAGGIKIQRDGSEMSTEIDETGMTVKYEGTEMLKANDQGVDARNLSASTFLIVGGRIRFENFGTDAVGCFWVGD